MLRKLGFLIAEETYGFDLSTCLVDREFLVAAGFPRDGLQALTNPEILPAAQLPQFDETLHKMHIGRFLVDHRRLAL